MAADKNATKKEQIIKTAMQLFAVKGSSSTSMQEIAELCGISKGSLYLVFKSKEELERSIYINCFRMIHDPLMQEELEGTRTPREKLRNQVEILLHHLYELREFLQRQVQELAGKGMADAPEWLRKINGPLLNWSRSKLETLYGKEILPYTGELFLIGHGMINSYIWALFNHDSIVAIPRLADHFVDLLDIVAAGLLAGRPGPLISPSALESWMEHHEGTSHRNPFQIIKQMKAALSSAEGLDPQSAEDALESIEILESEVLLPYPRKAIFQGMLANLQGYSVLRQEVEDLKKLGSLHMHNACSSQ
ncbi:TetR/AcrR family transcriptional regulator [Paenibacillus sp. S150]|uniref:TetR/AcrR family transcriptional regulator n=1 Tax=Paenibacillus sp. S150 TaxID=2749826 RepID=UPI001C561ED7|nr:TetR/AcrR family transcriptional regulator [Paenibacillus sp. S150]MBW4081731.1 TetR/AcrR family transcriptional regulator [Paenibacillus sp. S150]